MLSAVTDGLDEPPQPTVSIVTTSASTLKAPLARIDDFVMFLMWC